MNAQIPIVDSLYRALHIVARAVYAGLRVYDMTW